MNLIIRWDRKAIQQFADAIEYIEEDSLISADKFKQEILKNWMSFFYNLKDIKLINLKIRMMAVSALSKYLITEYHIVIFQIKYVSSV